MTYATSVICTQSDGLWDWDETAGIRDASGCMHYLRVRKGCIEHDDYNCYLPIALLGLDSERRRALIALPCETDSGHQRLWVGLERFKVVEATDVPG